jgi:DNA repair exonuclease SbcCD ATPase subunit
MDDDSASRSEVVSLRHYLEAQIKSLRELVEQARAADREAINAALTASKEALQKAEEATERRLTLLNEFRQQSADAELTYMRRDAAEAQHSIFTDGLKNVSERISNMEGRLMAVATGAALISIGVGIYAIVG